jgi:DNA-directed RNA polymerase subunit RPC12/RpoP
MAEKQTYKCPACGARITVQVKLTAPPTCSKHTGGGKAMTRIK